MPGVEPDIYGVRGTHVQSDWDNDWSKFHRHAEFQDMVSQPRVPTLNFLAREDVALKAYCESRGRYLGSCHRDASPPLGVSTKLGERYVYNKSPHGDNLEFGMTSCGQFSLTAMYTQVKDVDNHGVPVEQIKVRRYDDLVSWTATWQVARRLERTWSNHAFVLSAAAGGSR
jgi:hypothetical protein